MKLTLATVRVMLNMQRKEELRDHHLIFNFIIFTFTPDMKHCLVLHIIPYVLQYPLYSGCVNCVICWQPSLIRFCHPKLWSMELSPCFSSCTFVNPNGLAM